MSDQNTDNELLESLASKSGNTKLACHRRSYKTLHRSTSGPRKYRTIREAERCARGSTIAQ